MQPDLSGIHRRVCCILLCQEQYRLIYEAMREFLNRPGSYVLGRDCRAFPPTSLTQYRAGTQPSYATSSKTGAPASGSCWPAPAVTSPANHGNRQQQVRGAGPWRTPDPLGTPLDRTRYRPYQWTTTGQRRSPVSSQPVGDWATTWRDGAQLNLSMNRATADDEPGTNDVASVDKQHLASSSAAAVDSQPSVITSTPLSAADQATLDDRHFRLTATANDQHDRPTTVLTT